MNVNPIFKKFEKVIGHPVEQDEYEGKESIYFVFVYEDENSDTFGDNRPVSDTVYMQLKLYTPKNFDYFELKAMTTRFFEDEDWSITSKHTFLESDILEGAKRMRCTVFHMNYTEGR